MKKIISIIIGLSLITACFTGCSKPKTPVSSAPSEPTNSLESTDPVTDPSSPEDSETPGESSVSTKIFNTTVTEEFTGIRAKYTVKLPVNKGVKKVEITIENKEADCYFFESVNDPDVFYCVAEYYGSEPFPWSGQSGINARKAGQIDKHVITEGTKLYTNNRIFGTTEARNTKITLPGSEVEAYRYVGEMMGPAPDYARFAFAKGVFFYAKDNKMPITVFVVEANKNHLEEADALVDNIIASIRS